MALVTIGGTFSIPSFSSGEPAAGLTFDYYEGISNSLNTSFLSVSPFLGLSQKIGSKTTMHLSGQYNHVFSGSEEREVEKDWAVTATSIYSGLDYNLSEELKLLSEIGYDFTFKGYRIGGGLLFGWNDLRFRLAVSYYSPLNNGNEFQYPAGLWSRIK